MRMIDLGFGRGRRRGAGLVCEMRVVYILMPLVLLANANTYIWDFVIVQANYDTYFLSLIPSRLSFFLTAYPRKGFSYVVHMQRYVAIAFLRIVWFSDTIEWGIEVCQVRSV